MDFSTAVFSNLNEYTNLEILLRCRLWLSRSESLEKSPGGTEAADSGQFEH